MDHFALWLAALLTLGILSFLYKDNPWYKLCEAIFVGISAGYWVVSLFWENFYDKFYVNVGEHPELWIGGILGSMMLLRLVPKIGWISRWALAFIVGATAGLWMLNYFSSNVMAQLQNSVIPFYDSVNGSSWVEVVSNIVVFVGTFTGLIYFYFSKPHTGAFGGAAKVGIFFLMVTFGASFGYTVMSRMSLLIGRIDFLFGDWLGMIK